MFYSQNLSKQWLKIQNCGILLYKNYSHFAASPDGIANCKCHGKTLIEIKWPFNILKKTIQGIHECFFIVEKNNDDFLNDLFQPYYDIFQNNWLVQYYD